MTTTFYEHWRQVPEGTWRWKNFSPAEIVSGAVPGIGLAAAPALVAITRDGVRTHCTAIAGSLSRIAASRTSLVTFARTGVSFTRAGTSIARAAVLGSATRANGLTAST